ncbi:MAG: uroporphyrinogen-III synthase [Planctomycetia bacterium]|nr:uroporphyrinogen-III synthase [Planctomycetia bacterium]
MSKPLAGCTIALAESRQLEELAQLLEKDGATALRCPLVGILDAPEPAPILAWLDRLIAGDFAYVVLLTGEGLRRLLGFAERAGNREAVIAALSRTGCVTRGPKPMRALKEVGLSPALVAETPTTEGVIAALRTQELSGRTVGVQQYSPAPSPLFDFLRTVGATAVPVLPYVYAPETDAQHVADLIRDLAGGRVQVLCFTSSPQVDRLWEVAAQQGLQSELQQGLNQSRVAAVGPVVAENLQRRGRAPDICPEQGFVMKNLVQHIKRALER